MEEVNDKLEYAVRFGLQSSNNSRSKAANIAEAKFGSMMGRTPSAEEIREIQLLVDDIGARQREQQGIPSVAGLH